MALTLAELITEIQCLSGRTGDTVLITSARITRWLNEAQDAIVRVCVGHLDLETRGSLAALVSGTYQYPLSAVSPSVQHVLDIAYIDGTQSKPLDYIDTDQFDDDYPDPANSGITGIPCQWTRRGQYIEVYPVPGSAEATKVVKINYTKKPTAFAVASPSAVCSMLECDNGLIWYALAEAWVVIGQNDAEVVKYRVLFKNWLEDEYRPYKDGLYGSTGDGLYPGGA
jgi:hypothetical protein